MSQVLKIHVVRGIRTLTIATGQEPVLVGYSSYPSFVEENKIQFFTTGRRAVSLRYEPDGHGVLTLRPRWYSKSIIRGTEHTALYHTSNRLATTEYKDFKGIFIGVGTGIELVSGSDSNITQVADLSLGLQWL